MALISRTVLKSDWLNIGTTTTYDAMLDRFIDSVEAEIEGICGQPVDLTTRNLEFQGDGNVWVRMPYTSPVSLTALSYRDKPNDSWTAVTGGVVFSPNGVPKIYLENRFTQSWYSATLEVGYTTAPQDVQTCAYELCKELWNETPFASQTDRFGVSAVSESDAGVTINKVLVRARTWVEQRLQQYKVYGV